MAIADRIEEMYNHVGDVYDTIRNVDLPEDKNIENIPRTIKDSYLEMINNGTQQVWDNWDKTTGTGETLTLNNTEEAPMSLVYKGNTLQNGIPTPDSPVPIQVVSGDNSIVVCGRNHFDYEFAKDYSNTTLNVYRFIEIKNIKPNTTYSIYNYTKPDSTKFANVFLAWDNQYSGISFRNLTEYDFGQTLTKENGKLYLCTYSGNWTQALWIEFIEYFKNAMVVEGTDKSYPYEPYTGKSYPISLGVLGKNLFDSSTIVAGDIKGNNSTIRLCSLQNLWIEAGTYTFSTNMPSLLRWSISTQTVGVPPLSDYPTYDYNSEWQTLSQLTFTITNAGYFAVQFSKTGNQTLTVDEVMAYNFQLEKGSEATDYVKYNPIELLKIGTYQDKIDKSTGKNLFDKDNANILNCYMTSTGTIGNSSNDKLFYVSCKSNTTYTIQKILGTSGRLRVGSFTDVPANNSTPTVFVNRDNNTTATITTGANDIYLAVQYFASDTDNQALLNSIMLNEGTTALPYEPYGTGWYVKEEIGKVVLDGSENWTTQTSSGFYRYGLNITDIINNATLRSNILSYCNYFRSISFQNRNSDLEETLYIVTNDVDHQFCINTKTYTTLANFKTWLSSNNVTLYYVLATPTYTEIEDTTLINQLETIKKSYEGQTNITQENNDMPFELDVVALEGEQ